MSTFLTMTLETCQAKYCAMILHPPVELYWALITKNQLSKENGQGKKKLGINL